MAQDLFNVSGKVVIVTGGAGLIGSGFVRAFAERGAQVAVLDLPQAIDKAGSLKGDRIHFFAGDITSKKSLAEVHQKITSQLGAPHVLVNNAAIDSPPSAPVEENGPFETYPEASWDKVMTVNLKGMFLACQTFGKAMAEAKRGSIINISSIYGMVSPNQSLYEDRRKKGTPFYKPITYAVSKSGVLNLSRYLATYWAQQNVRVNTLTFAGVENHQDEPFIKAYCEKIPVGRMAEVKDYLGPVIFLASDASGYMTGSNLVVDGGWTAW